MSKSAARLHDAIRRGEVIRDLVIDSENYDGVDLSGGVFERVRFLNVGMKRTRLGDAVFNGCELHGVDLAHAELANCVFEQCRLDSVSLADSNLDGCVMSSTAAAGTNFCGVQANGFSCMKSDLSDAWFHDGRIDAAVFCETRLARTDFMRAVVRKAVFYQLDLTHMLMTDAIFHDTVFAESSLVGQRMRGQRMHRCQFVRADLRDADFTGATLAYCNFQGAKLAGARLDGVEAPFSIFFEAHGQGAVCRDATFRDSIWVQADLRHVDFSGAQLDRAVLQHAQCSGACFARTSLAGSDFSYVDLTGADFGDANFARTGFHGAISPDIAWHAHAGAIERDPALSDAQKWSRRRDEGGRRDDR
ncbi:pentapeptide repeat-containing protein [Burkholderia stagnalis]|uniref:pentapeptide repeat-containing protein n=1 Tax=Burkholderia stagnalis TaxID=1503054 RepID=UPI00075DAC18|nr:hypothetical protein WT18_04030 [Burkholderia stagnalis]KVP14321.1 hypothetical protein WT20_05930 [Burkholderia stagnalis]KVW94832.1 hypothetical protein WT30_15845 [Burkholderia stagnalis]KWH79654.1 hypothetical protein WT66_12245 [Burkholderia stagnalis]